VKKGGTRMVTQTLRGEFKSDAELRREFIQHINRPSSLDLD
jgi:GTP cyclohydrolase I